MSDTTDPLATLIQSHLTRMQEISDDDLTKTKEACAENLVRMQKNVGLRDAVLGKTLAALGLNPGEKENE